MGKIRAAAIAAVCAALVATAQPITAVAAECGTQGAFALAVAQLLGYEVADQGAAMSSLTNVGVEPMDGWDPEACVTLELAMEIDKDLKNAVSMGIFTSDEVSGVVALALSSIGEEEIVRRMTNMPNPFITRRSRVGGPPMEGSERLEPPQPPPSIPRTSTLPSASPFIP